MKKNQTILVVAAHPDDEVLGCGGTLLKHKEKGDKIHILILAEGKTSRDMKRDVLYRKEELSKLHDASNKVAEFLQAESLELCNFPDNRMDSIDLLDIVKKVESAIAMRMPDLIYTHYQNDLNIDHRITHQAVVTACRPLPESRVNTLLFFETPSSTEYQIGGNGMGFIPNWIVDITDAFPQKQEILKIYKEEMRDWPHARSYEAIEVLAKYRGYANGIKYAEAFQLGRKILK